MVCHVTYLNIEGVVNVMEEEEKLLNSARIKSYADRHEDVGKIITRKIRDTRLITVTYSVAIPLIGSLLFGYAIGYSSPVINELEKENKSEGYLDRYEYQGVFSVRKEISACDLSGFMMVYRLGAYANWSFSWRPTGWMVGRLHWKEEILVAV